MKDSFPSPWLGPTRGFLADWVTQKWVQFTGRSIDLKANPWLDGPTGETIGIGGDYFERLALKEGLELRSSQPEIGLVDDFALLESDTFNVNQIDRRVRDLYERTSSYDLDVWAEWSSFFRPFGKLLAYIFSRRLQQLNVPISSLDASRGMISEVIQLVDPGSGSIRYTVWLRHLVGTGGCRQPQIERRVLR